MDLGTVPPGRHDASGRAESSLRERLATPASAVAFWGAVGLPVLYLALLASGIDSQSGLGLFMGLVSLHVIALIGGRNHRLDRRSP